MGSRRQRHCWQCCGGQQRAVCNWEEYHSEVSTKDYMACALYNAAGTSSAQLAVTLRRCCRHINTALVQPTQAAVPLVHDGGPPMRPPVPVPRHAACRRLWQHLLQKEGQSWQMPRMVGTIGGAHCRTCPPSLMLLRGVMTQPLPAAPADHPVNVPPVRAVGPSPSPCPPPCPNSPASTWAQPRSPPSARCGCPPPYASSSDSGPPSRRQTQCP